MKTAKRMMKKCIMSNEDVYLALLNLRNTPQEGIDQSPVQRLFGRRTRTQLPTADILLEPHNPAVKLTNKQLVRRKEKMVENDRHSRDLPQLNIHDKVRMQPIQSHKSAWEPAIVTKQLSSRSYVVKTMDNREFRRDRQFLRKSQSAEGAPSQSSSRKSFISPIADLLDPDQPIHDKDPSPSVAQPNSVVQPNPVATKSGNSISSSTKSEALMPNRSVDKSVSSEPGIGRDLTSKSPMRTRSGRSVNKPKKLTY